MKKPRPGGRRPGRLALEKALWGGIRSQGLSVNEWVLTHARSYQREMIEVKIGSHTMFADSGEGEGPEKEYWGWVGNYLVYGFNDPNGLSLKYLNPAVQTQSPAYRKSLAGKVPTGS